MQAHFIKVQANLQKFQQTSCQGGYHTGAVNNDMEMFVAFANLEQATAEDSFAVTNLTTANITLTEQVEMYANCLYTKHRW